MYPKTDTNCFQAILGDDNHITVLIFAIYLSIEIEHCRPYFSVQIMLCMIPPYSLCNFSLSPEPRFYWNLKGCHGAQTAEKGIYVEI